MQTNDHGHLTFVMKQCPREVFGNRFSFLFLASKTQGPGTGTPFSSPYTAPKALYKNRTRNHSVYLGFEVS